MKAKGIILLCLFFVVAAIGRPNAVLFNQVTAPQIIKTAVVKPAVRHRQRRDYSYLPKKQLKKLQKTALGISLFEVLMVAKH